MVSSITGAGSLARKLNVICLLVGIFAIIIPPVKKQIWYDETVSILCSKGISHDTPLSFAKDSVINSSSITSLNTPANVFTATVLDNGNSFLYNISLHWFTEIFGNSLAAYMVLSKLYGIAALIAFYFLTRLFLSDSIFRGLAVLLLSLDTVFNGMSHEIRAYSMGILFVTLAALFLFRYIFEKEKPVWLFLTALWSVGAILSHFLTVYIVVALIVVLISYKRLQLFSWANTIAVLIPFCLLAVYFYFSLAGIRTMNLQNQAIQEKFSSDKFNMTEVIFRSMRIMAINFKIALPAFRDNSLLFLGSFALLLALFVIGLKTSAAKAERRTLWLLFCLGAASSVFLVLLSLKSRHYASLYFRYYSFGLPFSCLFIAYLLYVFSQNARINAFVKAGLHALILIPVIALFTLTIKSEHPSIRYNHPEVARQLVSGNVDKVTVPTWSDAFLIQSLLPPHYYLSYFRSATATGISWSTANGLRSMPVTEPGR